MTTPFPYHKLKRHGLQCLHCEHTATTTTGPPYCPLHAALTALPPDNGQRDPNLETAAQNAAERLVEDPRMTRLKQALQYVASNQ
jgi:hypothetical protein